MENDIVNHALLNAAARYRGWILNGTIVLERLVDVFLSCHFSAHKEDRDELMDLVFAASSGMPFDPKKNLLQVVLKRHHREFYDNNITVLHDIAFIIKQRNILAHYLLDRSGKAREIFIKEGKVGFVKFKEVTETIYFSDEDISNLAEKIENCIEKIKIVCPSDEDIENAPSRKR